MTENESPKLVGKKEITSIIVLEDLNQKLNTKKATIEKDIYKQVIKGIETKQKGLKMRDFLTKPEPTENKICKEFHEKIPT